MLQSWRKLYAKSENTQAYSLLSPALILVAVAMLVPMMLMLSFSFFTQVSMMEIDFSFTFQRYIDFFQKNLLVTLLIKSVKISFLVTLITLITAYPVCYYIAFYVKKNKMLWLVLLTLPFWTSYLLRVFSWKIILGTKGVINSSLINAGLLSEPLTFLMYSETAVIITLTFVRGIHPIDSVRHVKQRSISPVDWCKIMLTINHAAWQVSNFREHVIPVFNS